VATKYDSDVLQAFADRLYRRARWGVLWYGFLGLILGGAVGLILVALMQAASHSKEPLNGLALFFALIGALVGVGYGSEKAFQLRLDAQRTLCQLQIERNTRPSGSARAAG
jgi:uncharacterized membrane protein HdeD (DUF308 family)